MLNSDNHQQQQLREDNNCGGNSYDLHNSTTAANNSVKTLDSVRKRKRLQLLKRRKSSSSSSSYASASSSSATTSDVEMETAIKSDPKKEVDVLNLSQQRQLQKDQRHHHNNHDDEHAATSLLTNTVWLKLYNDMMCHIQQNGVDVIGQIAATNRYEGVSENAQAVKFALSYQSILERIVKSEHECKTQQAAYNEEKDSVPKGEPMTSVEDSNHSDSNGNSDSEDDSFKYKAEEGTSEATGPVAVKRRKLNKTSGGDGTLFAKKSKASKNNAADKAELQQTKNKCKQNYCEFASMIFQRQQHNSAESASSDNGNGSSTSRADSFDNDKAYFDKADNDTEKANAEEIAVMGNKTGQDGTFQHLKKFSSYLECKKDACRLQNLGDHLHCYEPPCSGEAIKRKEDFVKHVKWHSKRSESLAYGFLRYSANDDCTQLAEEAIANGGFSRVKLESLPSLQCQYNRKQTHYHCSHPHCTRVYVSTSDVQMHANYHKKATAINREGFQRFRAKDDCKAKFCLFIGQQTTHFHCCRDNCQFTFKHKADMEKHKSHHLKTLQLARDSFKRCLKNEPCLFDSCRFSGICNHIHCTRDNCTYVLHSSGQMESHKRKHERMDSEHSSGHYELLTLQLATLLGTATTAKNEKPDAGESDDKNPLAKSAVMTRPELCSASAVLERFKKMLQNQKESRGPNIDKMPATMTGTETAKMPVPSLNVTATTMGPMQITTIDGFFNRKRGRPPKNRFVEVYKNTQPTPQAIFTSFKLEKQSCSNISGGAHANANENVSTSTATIVTPDIFSKINDIIERHQKERPLNSIVRCVDSDNSADENKQDHHHQQQAKTENICATAMSTTATESKQQHNSSNYSNKNSSPALSNNSDMPAHASAPRPCNACPLMQQLHYHCRSADQCKYVTRSRDALLLHMEHLHTRNCFTDKINSQYARYDRVIGLDCGIAECRLRKTRPHLHCKRCLHQISPFDLESHECVSAPAFSPLTNLMTSPALQSQQQLQSLSEIAKPKSASTTFVRAAGTFYPENSFNSSSNCGDNSNILEDGAMCSRCHNKTKRKSNTHPKVSTPIFASDQKEIVRCQNGQCSRNASDNDMPQDLSLTPKIMRSSRHKKYPLITSSPAAMKLSKGSASATSSQDESFNAELFPFVSFHKQTEQPLVIETSVPTPGITAAFYSQLHSLSQTNPKYITRNDYQYPAFLGNITSATVFHRALSPSSRQQEMPGIASKNLEQSKPVNSSYRVRPQSCFKLKDDCIPVGYLRFRFNEDCGFPKCGYRNHQSHFHCDRNDCHYSFCDKTRFVQHTARHERLDTLMGEDFRQYRANMSCSYEDCTYFKNLGPSNKSSHFHCLKCNFICSDTNKVVAHRRQHNKMEYIRSAGFRKVASNESCSIEKISSTRLDNIAALAEHCAYSMKQTHYHCLVCECSVLSRAQLTSHRHKVTSVSTAITSTTSTKTQDQNRLPNKNNKAK